MNIIIVGGGKTGSYLASLLSSRGDTVRVIESRKTVVQRLEAKLPEGTVLDHGDIIYAAVQATSASKFRAMLGMTD